MSESDAAADEGLSQVVEETEAAHKSAVEATARLDAERKASHRRWNSTDHIEKDVHGVQFYRPPRPNAVDELDRVSLPLALASQEYFNEHSSQILRAIAEDRRRVTQAEVDAAQALKVFEAYRQTLEDAISKRQQEAAEKAEQERLQKEAARKARETQGGFLNLR